MIQPRSFTHQLKDSPSPREEMKANQRVDELKERIRVLVETPLFFNGDLIEEDLIQESARIL